MATKLTPRGHLVLDLTLLSLVGVPCITWAVMYHLNGPDLSGLGMFSNPITLFWGFLALIVIACGLLALTEELVRWIKDWLHNKDKEF